jgi:signal transduction histidine kinase
MAEMIFSDNGCGMSAEVLENIFEPFFTRRKVGKGTGLGLSITHRIVSQHHGEIMAFSAGEGQGAIFKVRLPIHPSEIGEDEQSKDKEKDKDDSRVRAKPEAVVAAGGVHAV